jgi:peptide/nickel transport system permease protein
MLAFLGKRLLSLMFTMLAVSALVFTAFEFTPGQVARKVLGPFATQDQVDQLTERMGLNRPVFERYFEWLGNTFSGNLGYHALQDRGQQHHLGPARQHADPGLVAFVIIVCSRSSSASPPACAKARSWTGSISVSSIVTTSVPEFASGVFLASIFVIWLGVLPGTSPLESGQWSIASQLVLPVAVMVLYDLGYVVRMVRASMVE